MLAPGVLEKLAALFNEDFLLLCSAPLVPQHPKTSITGQEMNVSCIIDLAVWAAELLSRISRSAIQEITSSQNHSPFARFRISIGNDHMEAFLRHFATG